jgi:hypothetical protein
MSNFINYSYTGLNDLNNIFADNADITVLNAPLITNDTLNTSTINVINENVSGNITLTGPSSVLYGPTIAGNNCIINGLQNNGNSILMGTLAVGGTSALANVTCNTLNGSNLISNMANLTNIGSTNAAISTLNCVTLNGANAAYYQNVTSDIQAQINSIVNSASVGGGGYFVMTAEASVMTIGNNYCFGASQANGFLYNVMPTCTLIGFSINCQTVLTTALKVDVKKNGTLLYRNSIAIGLNQIYASNISYGFSAGDTLQLYISTAGLPNANPSRVTLIFQTNGITGPQGQNGASSNISVGTTTTLSAGSSASVTNSGTALNPILNFSIPQGASITGPSGASSNISIGSTTTLAAGNNANVTNSGTALNPILNFSIPQGASITGPQGNNANVTIGSTTTLAAGSLANVTNSGTSLNPILNFSIPQGIQGNSITGPSGESSTITIGTTSTLTNGNSAYVTNSGTALNPILNFGLVSGPTGPTGPSGPTGSSGPKGSSGADGKDGTNGDSSGATAAAVAAAASAGAAAGAATAAAASATTASAAATASAASAAEATAIANANTTSIEQLQQKTTDISYGLTGTTYTRSVLIGPSIDLNSNGKITANNLQINNCTIDTTGNIQTNSNLTCNDISSNELHSYSDTFGISTVDVGFHAGKINLGSTSTTTTNIEANSINIGTGSILNTVNIGNVFSTVNITGINGSAINIGQFFNQF